ncbi:alpha-amylase family glycosyl hydrolase [Mycoplasma miroungirhinis]|uniref:Glycosyl hydrolase family 13 catalytic domain-containing protein n=1 Tax=Mycoplasma miroungirhinis TaxID=754516 RepID=A0A6M4JAS5_9MOLU|nr:alpha-amylase family glycosyl hydrolase [Mycoplasma miroungirhinis]QJR44094.1 hypothetical protein HLA92_01430 [Mycoplasma miroungirhinis]
MTNKKMILYQLKIDKFKDSNETGYGDYNGLLYQIKYFQFLGVDGLILNNILDYYQNAKSLDEIESKYGSILDFKKMINFYVENNFKIGINLDFNNLRETFNNWKQAKILHENKNFTENQTKKNTLEKYIDKNNKENNIFLNQTEFIDFYTKIFDFYLNLGCNFFVININNEQKNWKNNNIKDNQLNLIQNIYKISKQKNKDFEIIIKTQNLELIKIQATLSDKLFDFIFIDSFSEIGSDKAYKNKLMIKFKPSQLIKELRNCLNYNNVIISLASENIGRINSRWGDELAFTKESAKSFALLLLSARNSANIYYGDELGLLKAKIEDYHDFNEFNYNETKRYLEAKNISTDIFYNSYLYQHPVSVNNIMPWNTDLNFGFSKIKNKRFIFAENSKENNVLNEFKDPTSPLNFYKYLIDLQQNQEYSEIFNKAKLIIYRNYFKKGILKIKYKLKTKKIMFVINISKKAKNIHLSKKYEIIKSTYHNKKYLNIPNSLDPFESIILLKK